MMKRDISTCMQRASPYAWVGALFFFLISEGLILVAETHGLLAISLTRRLSLPVLFTLPLIASANFARSFKKYSVSLTCTEILNLASGFNAILLLTTYALLTVSLGLLF